MRKMKQFDIDVSPPEDLQSLFMESNEGPTKKNKERDFCFNSDYSDFMEQILRDDQILANSYLRPSQENNWNEENRKIQKPEEYDLVLDSKNYCLAPSDPFDLRELKKQIKEELKYKNPEPGTNYQEGLENSKQIEQIIPESHKNVTACIQEEKKEQKTQKKLSKKISKFLLKEKSFKGTQKISLPKKIGKLFVNYIDEYHPEDREIEAYNQTIKGNLKKNVKNDYTFEKTIARFLGEQEKEGKMTKTENTDKISRYYRESIVDIIQKSMKKEVIMRQKIQRNKRIYMIQLKTYCLRCRSHLLAQKGSFK